MPVDDYTELERVAAGGWDGLEGAQRVVGEARRRLQIEEREADAKHRAIVQAALSGPAGTVLMLWLQDQTLLLPPTSAELSATTAEAYAIEKARREGQNAIVFRLMEFLKPAKEGDNL